MTARLIASAVILFIASACANNPPAELDLEPFQNRMCDLLTLDQLAGFQITQPGTPGDDHTRPSCLWQIDDTRILVTLNVDPYVSTSPAKEDAGMINGFPASRWGIPGKGVQLACATTIDTRRRQTFTATVYAPNDACAASDTIASLVIDTARAGRPAAGTSSPSDPPELDLTPYQNRPCDLLTPDQLAPFAISGPGKQEDTEIGPGCVWEPVPTRPVARVTVTIASKLRNGLDGVRARKDMYGFFEEAGKINGYPAVHTGSGNGREGSCHTRVGVRRDLVVDVYVFWAKLDSPEYRMPCTLSDRLATQLIDNVRSGR